MNKYLVTKQVTINYEILVEAESEQDARDMVLNNEYDAADIQNDEHDDELPENITSCILQA
jgi:hypothetical protein